MINEQGPVIGRLCGTPIGGSVDAPVTVAFRNKCSRFRIQYFNNPFVEDNKKLNLYFSMEDLVNFGLLLSTS